MKSFLLSTLAILFTVSLNAQPVINQNIIPTIGDRWDITFFEPTNFNPGSGGANQVWDFSGLDISNAIDLNFQALNPTDVLGHTNFPTADFAIYLFGFENYQFYSINQDSIPLVGGVQVSNQEISFMTIFTDPEDGLHLPVHYGDSYNYYSYFEQYFGGSLLATNDRNGSVTADAYGTIITPSGTYPNVLRLIIQETSFGETNTQYAWYDVNNFTPVLLYETSTDNETPASLYYTTSGITSSINDISIHEFEWKAWANNSNHQINVEIPTIEDSKNATLLLYNMEGKALSSKIITLSPGVKTYSTFDIPKGINCENLVLQLNTTEETSTKKLWVCKN